MAYPTGHRTEVKRKIVGSARRLFNRHGFDNVSITQIMAGAGLTHGGFYSYFKSKSDLYAEVLGCFFTDPEWKSCWEGVEVDLSSADVGPQSSAPICLASTLRTSRTPARWSRAHGRLAQRRERQARVRNCFSGHGQCSGA